MKISNLNNFSINDLYLSSQNKYYPINYHNINGKSNRNLGIDLLRIFAMINIIIWHINSFSKLNLLGRESSKFKPIWLLNALSLWPINGFGMISGFVGYKKYKFSNLIYIWILSSFYSFIISSYFFYKKIKDIKFWLLNLFPIAMYKYWYVNAYFCMYLFLPFINNGIIALNQKLFCRLILFYFLFFSIYDIIVSVILNDNKYNFLNKGFSSMWLMILYIIGGYIGKYKNKNDSNYIKSHKFFVWIFIYACLAYFNFKSYDLFIKKKINFNNKIFFSYTSPTMIFEAICLLFFFSNLTIKNPILIKLISFFAPLTFNVYLFHTRVFDIIFFYEKSYFYKYITGLGENFLFFKVYLISIIIFIFCSFIDYLRALLFKLMKVREFCIYIENSFPKIIDFILGSFSFE